MNALFDPKLKEAAEEIKVILKKYDCNASMLLVSPSHCEYLFHVDSSWSVIRLESSIAGSNIRIRSKKEDFRSKQEQDKATEASVHFLTSTLQWGRMVEKNMQNILKNLKNHMTIAYKIWD